MRGSRSTDEQIVGVLREADAGASTGDLCRRHGISPAAFYNSKARLGGMGVPVGTYYIAASGERRAASSSRRAARPGFWDHCP